MRRLSLLIAVSFVLPLLGSDSPKEYDDRVEIDNLEGKWRLVAFKYEGRSFQCLDDGMTYYRGKFTWTGRYFNYKGVYRINLNQKTAQIDLIDDRTIKGIYRIDGDILTLATLAGKDKRPLNFDTKDYLNIWTFKRVK